MRKLKIDGFGKEFNMVRQVIWRTFQEQWEVSPRLLILNLLFIPFTALMPLLSSYLAGEAINKLVAALSDKATNEQVYIAFAVAAIAGLSTGLLSPLQRYIRDSSQTKLELFLERRMNQYVIDIDLPTIESPSFAEVFNKVVYRHVFAHTRVTDQVMRLGSSLLQLIGAAVVLISFSLWLLPILLVAIAPTVITTFYIGRQRDRIVWKDPENLRSLERRTGGYLYELSTNIEIRLNTAKKFFLDTAERLRRVFAEREQRVFRMNFKFTSLSQAFEEFILLLIQLSLVGKVLSDRSFGVGTYTFYFQTVQRFASSSSNLFNNLGWMYEDCLVLKDFYSLADMKPVVVNKLNSKKLRLKKSPLIEFVNVEFSYPGADKPVIKNLNLKIEPGEKVALVGENGAGKTTIVKLLSRLYDVTKGQILIDGVDVRDIDIESWHKHLGALMQHYGRYIYNVQQNVGIGRIEKMNNKALVKEALERADAMKFVNEFKHGLDQPLATMFKDGTSPSGGQWQRMALARAMFRNAEVLILDEPTAAVDAKAEYQIFKRLLEQQKEKTTLIISHRFSTVRQADTIYVLEDGEIKERGSHQQLMEIPNGHYKSLFEMQAEGYR